MNKILINKHIVGAVFGVITIAIVTLISLHLYYFSAILPRVSGRISHHISQEELYQGIYGFEILDEGIIVSRHADAHINILVPIIHGNVLDIDISGLSRAGSRA